MPGEARWDHSRLGRFLGEKNLPHALSRVVFLDSPTCSPSHNTTQASWLFISHTTFNRLLISNDISQDISVLVLPNHKHTLKMGTKLLTRLPALEDSFKFYLHESFKTHKF